MMRVTRTGVLAHSQTRPENKRDPEVSLENKGKLHAILINRYTISMYTTYYYTESAPKRWLTALIQFRLTHPLIGKCLLPLSPPSKTGACDSYHRPSHRVQGRVQRTPAPRA